jgi:F0F1-type ATP synthase delta subunit
MSQAIDQAYARAIWRAVEAGKEPHEAVSIVYDILKRQDRTALMPRILRSFTRLADKELRRTQVRLSVARQGDVKQAMIEAGIQEADVCIDESIIGGWRLETSDRLVDASHKKYLLDIFIRATR